MPGLLTVFRKEVADHFRSKRIIILLIVIWLTGLSAIYIAGQSIREAAAGSEFVFLKLFMVSEGTLPPFIGFVAFFGPLIGLALGFDAINREQSGGTLSLVLSQPIFRDLLINGKFLAGLSVIAFMLVSIVLIVCGLGLFILAVPPSLEEALRIIAYTAVTIIYIGFWMALAILFSIFFKRITTSALAGIALWLFFIVFISMIAGLVADQLAPIEEESLTAIIQHEQLKQAITRASPAVLYEEAMITLLQPQIKSLGIVAPSEMLSVAPGPLPFTQSLLIIWPHLVTIFALTLICFIISYVKFLRQEIRAG
jgi:ABC-2 type transport system permease protein